MKPMPLAALLSFLLSFLLLVAVPSAAAAARVEPHGAWPLRPQPEVVRAFDPPTEPWGNGHRGVDLRATIGQPVRAALPGRVSYAGVIAGVGVVVVDHGGLRTTYQPVAAEVSVGAEVDAGSVLGALTWFGGHCLPSACLHWGLVRGATYLDPLSLVGGPRPVRLLPLGAAEALTSRLRPTLPPVSPGLLVPTPWR